MQQCVLHAAFNGPAKRRKRRETPTINLVTTNNLRLLVGGTNSYTVLQDVERNPSQRSPKVGVANPSVSNIHLIIPSGVTEFDE